MATLYWGGGSGTWDGFTTTNWYTDLARTVLSTRAPSAEDDVIFDAASNATAYTVTISNNTTVCRDCTISGPATGNLTLAGSGQWYVYGSLIFPATGFTRTYTGVFGFYGTGSHTITSNGVTFASNMSFAGSGTYTLQDALNLSSGGILISNGTVDTDGKSLTFAGTLNTTPLGVNTLKLGASTVTSSGNIGGNLYLDAGTSNITISATNIALGSFQRDLTYYNVTLSNGAPTNISMNAGGTSNITTTFNNLTFTTRSSAGVSPWTIGPGGVTVNGTLTISGQSGANRYFVRSDTLGAARTLTVNTVGALTDVDFRDITVAGTSSPWSGTRLGDCKGNTNITFVAGASKYIAAATGSSNWSANIWSNASGGAASTADFPLAQDTVIIDNSGLNTSATLTANIAYNVGAIDSSSRTNAMTFTGTAGLNTHADVNISTNVTVSGAGGFSFAGRNTQNLTSNGKTIGAISVNSPGGTLVLVDNLVAGTSSVINVNAGTFNANNKNITCSSIQSTGSLTRTLSLGSGTITTTNGVYSNTAVSNLTVSATTATITCSTSATLGFVGTSCTLNGAITVSGAGNECVIRGPLTVASLTLTASTATGLTSKLYLSDDLTVTGTLALGGGTSVTQRALVVSTPVGTQRTLSAATVTGLTDIDFRDINAAGVANWTTGTRLGDCGGNAGITFPAAKTVYWNLAGTQNWSATGWSAVGSGGTPAANDFPLAQDTAVFDDTGAAGTVTINESWNIGTIDASARTSAMTLSGSSFPSIYGSVTYASGITASTTAFFTFVGRGTQTFTTAGKSLSNSLDVNKPAGTFQHGDAYTSTGSISVTRGTYTTQNYNVTASEVSSSNSNTRSITFGTSTLTLSGTTPLTFATATGLTLSAASSTINLSSTSSKTFNGGTQTFGTVSSTGGTTNPLTITGNNTFNTLTNSARTFLVFANGTTQTVTNFTYSGAVGAVVRLYSSIPGQRATIVNNGSGNTFGVNSVDGGNNSNVSFTGTTNDYFYVKDIAYSLPPVQNGNFLMFFA